jgi:hypothetical protein
MGASSHSSDRSFDPPIKIMAHIGQPSCDRAHVFRVIDHAELQSCFAIVKEEHRIGFINGGMLDKHTLFLILLY